MRWWQPVDAAGSGAAAKIDFAHIPCMTRVEVDNTVFLRCAEERAANFGVTSRRVRAKPVSHPPAGVARAGTHFWED